MLRVSRVHLPSHIPIVGCELTPYLLIQRPDSSMVTDDITESAPVDGCYLGFKWYRIQSEKKGPICSVHPYEQAIVQCTGCLKANVPVAKSYHCSSQCFSNAWHHHRVLHEKGKGNEEEGLINSAAVTHSSGSAILVEVAHSKTYIPTPEDVGHVLKFECAVIDAQLKLPVGHVNTVYTSLVIPAPTPIPRRLFPLSVVDMMGNLGLDKKLSSSGTFTVLSYNILSDIYAAPEFYSYCPPWALSWSYRRQNLLREIASYHADIVCLQEVQSDHFEEFFAPELDKHGYQSVYKKRTNEVYTGNPQKIDGCATFFRRDRFSQVRNYEIEFNKAVHSLTEDVLPPAQKKTALNRLLKDNVALIVVLEAKIGNRGADSNGNRQLLCVTNTHVHIHKELKDVKLWQVHTLLKGLGKLVASTDMPMLLCGDFNSVPGSAPHALLTMGTVNPLHPELSGDPLGILQPHSKLIHQLPLVSAYSSFARIGVSLALEEQRRKLDPNTNEPRFTTCTRNFIGAVDYIFYTADSLTVESLLELLDENSMRRDTALPSPLWSSDHIALLAEFRYKPKPRH